ncbi:hypothetical protein O988_08689 [Pseudogymnoascus sp. VKM F-3808]|nr:hypothetical protein O988_08689 [Pseudogymnoascus sp. VKM F-3808]
MHFYTLLNSPFPLPSKSLFPFHPSPQAPPHRSPSDHRSPAPTAYQCTSAPTLTQSEPRARQPSAPGASTLWCSGRDMTQRGSGYPE